MKERVKTLMEKLMRRTGWGVAVAVVAMATVAVWTVLAVEALEYDPQAETYHGWGEETLSRVHEGLAQTAPIKLANACGLGASSCFKCHNDQRADKQSDKKWHTMHSDVNHSCAGCHQGNERLMVKGMAHRDLLADPREHPGKSCASCHDDNEDIDSLLNAFAE